MILTPLVGRVTGKDPPVPVLGRLRVRVRDLDLLEPDAGNGHLGGQGSGGNRRGRLQEDMDQRVQ